MVKKDEYGSSYDPNTPKKERKKKMEQKTTFSSYDSIGIGASYQEMWDAIAKVRTYTTYPVAPIFSEDVSANKTNSPPSSYTYARGKVKEYLQTAPEQSFEDIVGNEEALALLKDAIQAPILHKELYSAYSMKMPKGALLFGPPGCGKTMFARAAAAEMKRLYKGETEFICLSANEIQSCYAGETEKTIKNLFSFAREYRKYKGFPLLIFIDEAEALLPDRTGRARRVYPWEESQVASFLAEMDGVNESGAFVLLATNRPEALDQAVLRDGRCDFKIEVKRPTKDNLKALLDRAFEKTLIQKGVDKETLVFAAIECFCDPHKVLAEAHTLGFDFDKEKIIDLNNKHFLFEHIISGAMVVSVPTRASRLAFARDKLEGTASGISVQDVITAVNGIYEENKGLDQSFALNEFRKSFLEESRRLAKDYERKMK